MTELRTGQHTLSRDDDIPGDCNIDDKPSSAAGTSPNAAADYQASLVSEQKRRRALLAEALRLADASYGCVLRTDDATGLLVPETVLHLSRGTLVRTEPPQLPQRHPDQTVREVIDVLKPVFSNDPSDSELRNLPHSHPVIDSFAICPVHDNGSLRALMFVANARHGFDIVRVERIQQLLDTRPGKPAHDRADQVVSEAAGQSATSDYIIRCLQTASSDAIISVDEQLVIYAFNPACEQLFRIDADTALGGSLHAFIASDTLKTIEHRLAQSHDSTPMTTLPGTVNNARIITSDSSLLAVDLALFHVPVRGRLHTTLIIHDRQHAATRQELARPVDHDPLTGLPNRSFFLQHLHSLLAHQGKYRNVSLLFIDLDGFKAVNDTLGHLCGDELLRQVASRLRHHTRQGDSVARLGGDAFTVTLRTAEHTDTVRQLANTLLHAIAQPFVLQQEEVFVTASIGIAMTACPDNRAPIDTNTLIKQADVALSRAKRAGRARYVIFTPELDQAQRNRSILISKLRRAVEREEFELFYQPQLLIRDRRLLGFEALLRWPQAQGRSIAPCDFIDILEDTGMIDEVGQWAINEACRQHVSWLRDGLIGPGTTMSVNVSAQQLSMPQFATVVAGILKRHQMRPDSLILEITESTLVQTIETDIIKQIKALGVQISLDDFGTGYSSLAYLSKLPLDHLKIDRSFIANIDRYPHAITVIKSIIALARTLGIRVIAEGVENAAVLPLLAHEGCEGYQGFHYSAPLSVAHMAERLQHLDKVRLSHYACFIDLGEPVPTAASPADAD